MIEARSGANKIPGSRKGGRKRMINSMAIRDFWDFEHYGCWCIEKKGYGPAVDEVDFACLGKTKTKSDLNFYWQSICNRLITYFSTQ